MANQLTTTATLTQELFDMIAAEMLIRPDDDFLYLREVVPMSGTIEPGAKTVQFNQPNLPTGSYDEVSRRLTDGTDIDAGLVDISLATQVLTVREYGGPHDGTAVRPFAITDRLKRMAKHDLATMLGEFLRRDRNKAVNKRRMDSMLTATNVVTPDGSAEGVVGAGLPMTAAMLRRMNRAMKDLLIPRYANGRWKLIISTTDEESLKADPDVKKAFELWAAMDNPAIKGQIGVFENFDIIVDTLIPTKAVGDQSAVTGYQSMAFGPYHLGETIVMQPEPRRAVETDYGRKERMIWLSLEAVGFLYPALVVRGVTTPT